MPLFSFEWVAEMKTWPPASWALLLPNPNAGAFFGPSVLGFSYFGPGF
eukprot:COSAG06_NODE_59690_length_273_cov_0.862069_1_plen_47_part_01